jgi:hypothetical protein
MSPTNSGTNTPQSDSEVMIIDNLCKAWDVIGNIKKKQKIAEKEALLLDRRTHRLEGEVERSFSLLPRSRAL